MKRIFTSYNFLDRFAIEVFRQISKYLGREEEINIDTLPSAKINNVFLLLKGSFITAVSSLVACAPIKYN